MCFFISDEGTDCAVGSHYLESWNESTVNGGQQLLANYGIKHHGKLYSYLMLLIYREYVYYTVDSICSAQGMQCRKHELTGLGGSHCNADGFVVAHFAEQDNIRRLAQRSAERVDVAVGVDIDLTLADYAAIVLVEELYRILYSYYMPAAILVDTVEDT